MRQTASIPVRFLRDPRFLSLSSDAKLVYLHLGFQASVIGSEIYIKSPRQIAADIDLSTKEVNSYLEILASLGLIEYGDNVIWVRGIYPKRKGKFPPKIQRTTDKQLSKIPNCPTRQHFESYMNSPEKTSKFFEEEAEENGKTYGKDGEDDGDDNGGGLNGPQSGGQPDSGGEAGEETSAVARPAASVSIVKSSGFISSPKQLEKYEKLLAKTEETTHNSAEGFSEEEVAQQVQELTRDLAEATQALRESIAELRREITELREEIAGKSRERSIEKSQKPTQKPTRWSGQMITIPGWAVRNVPKKPKIADNSRQKWAEEELAEKRDEPASWPAAPDVGPEKYSPLRMGIINNNNTPESLTEREVLNSSLNLTEQERSKDPGPGSRVQSSIPSTSRADPVDPGTSQVNSPSGYSPGPNQGLYSTTRGTNFSATAQAGVAVGVAGDIPVTAATFSPKSPGISPREVYEMSGTKRRGHASSPDPDYRPIFSQLASTCRLNMNLMGGKIGTFAQRLRRAGYTAEDIKTFEAWWYANDWRGQRGQVPSLEFIVTLLPQALAASQEPASAPASAPAPAPARPQPPAKATIAGFIPAVPTEGEPAGFAAIREILKQEGLDGDTEGSDDGNGLSRDSLSQIQAYADCNSPILAFLRGFAI